MSEQRWAVLGDLDGDGWVVAHPDDTFRRDGRLDFWDDHSVHDTWAEAMQEADRMARTITVTLPRLAPEEWTEAGGFHVISEPPWCGDALEVHEIDDYGYFTIGREDCEPLALALLAHARKETN